MKTRNRIVRILVALAVLVLAVASAHFEGALPIGTLCVLCPVGFAQIAAASGGVPWGLLPGVIAVLAIVFLLGRVFCSWVCPTQMLKNVFGGHKPRGILGRSGETVEGVPAVRSCGCGESACAASAAQQEVALASEVSPELEPSNSAASTAASAGSSDEIASASASSADIAAPKPSRTCTTCGSAGSLKTQGIVLAVLLVVSFVVKFPVFCLFCPIGLVFGTLWAFNRVFVLLQPGWELIIFPLMLIAELFLFKKWCAAICPLGFFFGLMAKARAKLGFGVRPRADCSTCIAPDGCRTCSTVCPEDIDVSTNDGSVILQDCSLCGDCTENCPTKSIKFELKSR